MAHRILEVSIANAYLKQLIESDVVLSDCWIQGEVSERFESRNGHVYFTLVDSESMLKSVIFRGQASRQRSSFQNGDLVVAHGRMSVYEQRSQYQFIADSIQPAGLVFRHFNSSYCARNWKPKDCSTSLASVRSRPCRRPSAS